MRHLIVSISLLLLFAGCKELSEPTFSDQLDSLKPTDRENLYQKVTEGVQKTKKGFQGSTSDHQLDSLGDLLHQRLTDSVFQFWYGTPWDYNGVTQTPRKGKIACGYFVSTTLKQCGFQVQRVKLAQQASSKIISTLCDPATKKVFTNNNFSGLKQHLDTVNHGLYIIGLDNHVAFISKEATGIFVIHSSPPKVKRQKLDNSSVVTQSNYHVIANFSHHKEVLKKWIKNEQIPTKL